MKRENQFMLMFRYKPNFNYQPSKEEMSHMKKLWDEYIGNLVDQEKLVHTHQLGFDGRTIDAQLSISDKVITENAMTLSGNMVIRVNSIEEASEIAKGSPILTMGGSVEVRNIIPMN